MTQTEQRVTALVETHARIPHGTIPFTDTRLFEAGGLGLDSIDALEILMAVEKEFNVEIPQEEEHLRSVHAIAAYIDAHGGSDA